MSLTVHLHDDAVDIGIHGAGDRLLCLSRGVRLPWSEIVGARATTWADVREGLGWRVGGGYLPGVFATGWFTVPGRRGHRQLLHVYRDRAAVLVIDTTRTRPARVVLATPDAVALATAIEARRRGD